MSVAPGFAQLLQESLAPLGLIAVRNMFGGAGVYCDGIMFALVADGETLYLKGDPSTRADFEAEGCGPFVYDGKGKPITMSYWRMPERLLDEPEEMVEWALKALRIARLGAAGKAGKASKVKSIGRPARTRP